MIIKKNLNKGFALVYALFMVLIFSLLISTMTKSLMNSIKDSKSEFRKSGQAGGIAKAGLEQAFFWFVKQNSDNVDNGTQKSLYGTTTKEFFDPDTNTYSGTSVARDKFFLYPDSGFFPTYDIDPNKRDTDDEKLGMIQDIEIDKSTKLFGTFVVKRQVKNNDPNTTGGSFNNNVADSVHDVSILRSVSSSNPKGKIWRLNSTGYLYIRNNYDKLTDNSYACTYDNRRRTITNTGVVTYTSDSTCNNSYLSESKASVDIQRISLNSNSYGAVLIQNPTKVTVGTGTSIKGGSRPGVIHKASSLPSNNTRITGAGDTVGSIVTGFKKDLSLNISTANLLSLEETELKGLADQNETSLSQLKRGDKKSLGSYQIICITPKNITYNDSTYEVVFDQNNPLKGSGIMFIDGDVKITNDSSSLFSGILYVKGSLRIEANNEITGAVVLGNTNSKLDLVGTGGSAVIEYSPQVMSNISKRMAKYRKNSLSFKFYDSNR
jgi:hypothetical protein